MRYYKIFMCVLAPADACTTQRLGPGLLILRNQLYLHLIFYFNSRLAFNFHHIVSLLKGTGSVPICVFAFIAIIVCVSSLVRSIDFALSLSSLLPSTSTHRETFWKLAKGIKLLRRKECRLLIRRSKQVTHHFALDHFYALCIRVLRPLSFVMLCWM